MHSISNDAYWKLYNFFGNLNCNGSVMIHSWSDYSLNCEKVYKVHLYRTYVTQYCFVLYIILQIINTLIQILSRSIRCDYSHIFIIFIMGSKCSTYHIGGQVHISGDRNAAVIINGTSYNISSLFNAAIDIVMHRHRSEMILIQLASILFIVISLALIVRVFMRRMKKETGLIVIDYP